MMFMSIHNVRVVNVTEYEEAFSTGSRCKIINIASDDGEYEITLFGQRDGSDITFDERTKQS